MGIPFGCDVAVNNTFTDCVLQDTAQSGVLRYNEFGECVMMIPRKGISVLLTIAGLIGVLYVLTGAFQFSYAAGVVVTLLLMAWEVFALLKDIRNLQIWKEQNGVA